MNRLQAKINNLRIIFTLFFFSFYFLLQAEDVEVVVEKAAVEDVASADADALAGEKLFKQNCTACHKITGQKLIGPGLQGISEKREEEWLIKWIKNSQQLIESGDADAKAIYEEYGKLLMPAQALSDEEVKQILEYIKNPPVKEGEKKTEVDAAGTDDKSADNNYVFYTLLIIVVVLFILVLLLHKRSVLIATKNAEQDNKTYEGPTSLWGSIRATLSNNKEMVVVVVSILLFAGIVKLILGGFSIGVHTDYKPIQPIKFSHKVHAGDNKIDCNYCHSSARHSKTSGIPSLNVCMNCHRYVDGTDGKTFMYNGEEHKMTEEIKKIYAALDYDPNTQKYGDNPTPVKWVKVHNLPDFVFFSHQQHVAVGGQKCQTCHGPVEEMDVLKQEHPLTMKWCVECHDKSEVSTKGNGYYEDLHSRMDEKHREKLMKDGQLTVREMGGWECAKCHY